MFWVGHDIVNMVSCDAQHVGRIEMQPANDAGKVDGFPTARDADSEGRAHVGAARAKQDVPPAVRRTVLRRDGRRCRVPGCRNATFLDLHHIDPRSEGGGHHVDNLLTVCGSHHRALHRGELSIDASSAANARFRHADGTPYGEAVQPKTLEVQTKVFGALRGLGFREREVRCVLGELRKEIDPSRECAEGLLRAALHRLTSASR